MRIYRVAALNSCTNSPEDPHFIKRFVSPELYDRMKSYATENFAQLKLGAVTCPYVRLANLLLQLLLLQPRIILIVCSILSSVAKLWIGHDSSKES